MAGTSFDSWDDEMTVLTEKLAIPAGNTAGLRLALPEPYNLWHGTGALISALLSMKIAWNQRIQALEFLKVTLKS